MKDYSNLLERLQEAVRLLKQQGDTPKERLTSAILHVAALMTKEFPPDLQAEWDALQKAIQRVSDEERGSARASIDAMTHDEVQRWSDVIIRICANIRNKPRR